MQPKPNNVLVTIGNSPPYTQKKLGMAICAPCDRIQSYSTHVSILRMDVPPLNHLPTFVLRPRT